MGGEKLSSTVTGVEMFRKILDRGEFGDNVGILLEVSKKLTSVEEWLFVNLVLLNHIRNLKLKFIF